MQKLLILSVAALGYDLLKTYQVRALAGLSFHPLTTTHPAVTCTAQATLRTALPPEAHRMPSNGLFLRDIRQPQFWNQSSRLVQGARIWEPFRAKGGTVGLYFFQQSLGESVDEILSPAPIHTHGGGLIMATYSQPESLLKGKNPVPLWRYWGPLASPKVGRSIVQTLTTHLARGTAPDLCCVYLPTLDYDLQRYGTQHRKIPGNIREVVSQIESLITVARQQHYEVVIVGDYAISDVTGSVCYPNRALTAAGFMATRTIRGMRYPDFHRTAAFALCDHQTALVYCQDPSVKTATRTLLETLPEVDTITDTFAGADFLLTAKPGCWFAYPWWQHPAEAPDFATHVDIHNKPGFDPCELFFGKTPFQCSTRPEHIRGTHGRNNLPVACASTLNCPADTLQGLAASIRDWLKM